MILSFSKKSIVKCATKYFFNKGFLYINKYNRDLHGCKSRLFSKKLFIQLSDIGWKRRLLFRYIGSKPSHHHKPECSLR